MPRKRARWDVLVSQGQSVADAVRDTINQLSFGGP